MSLTIVIPNRNRNLTTVRRTLDSISNQSTPIDKIVLVDYGSALDYQKSLVELVTEFPSIDLIVCPTQGQLFHKTRAINIVLKKCQTTYFMVLDMDCITHADFIQTALHLAEDGNIYNFPYGFLDEEESKLTKPFAAYDIHHVGELTGTAIFKTKDLLDIQGFDEFYHNWGSEDADVFERLKRKGIETVLYTENVLLIHQWHPKFYRTEANKDPFHSHLERINFQYFLLSNKRHKIVANCSNDWGEDFDTEKYTSLENASDELVVNSTEEELSALIAYLNLKTLSEPLKITIIKHQDDGSVPTKVKKIVGRKLPLFLSLKNANNILLEAIVTNLRNQPYIYCFDSKMERIELTIISTDLR